MRTTLARSLLLFSFFPFPLFHCSVFSQTNVRAWYADGQMWVVWEAAQPYPETFAIFKNSTAFTSTSQATPVGRLFHYEYLPGTYVEQTGNPNFTYKIPMPNGLTYQLAPGEGLFVETVTNTGSSFYAVVSWGNTAVAAGVNITPNAVPYIYDPVNDPVNCHLQLTVTLPTGHKTNWYNMWALGKQQHWADRPDFPVMANAFKNGMPSMFIVSEAIGLDTSDGKKIPATHWFHGGGMVASQFLANDFKAFNIEPQQGISVAHNDDFAVKTIVDGDTVFTSGRSLWFGWSKAHNPFNPGFDAGPGDTIINYTQRRILWINNWLIKHYNVDSNRVALQGYSMGSAGASALAKAFPRLFSTVCAFNNGFRAGIDPTSQAILGSIAENLPTNLRRSPNDVARINEVFDMTTRISPARDLPLFRTWAGKNDSNERMFWGPDLVAQYRRADSLGTGAQISWDERSHVYDVLGFHWIDDFGADKQTYRDDLAFQENFRSNESYPAFFNHRLDPQNNDPGTGLLGINNGDGDNWGAWGGWHRWENVVEADGGWQATVWLESNAAFANDNCPHDSLNASLAIRRPQFFKPAVGTPFYWGVDDLYAGIGLQWQGGMGVVQADGLVVVPQVTVYKESIRKVRITVSNTTISTKPEPGEVLFSKMKIEPNPSAGVAFLSVFSKKETAAKVRATHPSGKVLSLQTRLFEGENRVSLADFESLASGFYLVEINADGQRQMAKWVKI